MKLQLIVQIVWSYFVHSSRQRFRYAYFKEEIINVLEQSSSQKLICPPPPLFPNYLMFQQIGLITSKFNYPLCQGMWSTYFGKSCLLWAQADFCYCHNHRPKNVAHFWSGQNWPEKRNTVGRATIFGILLNVNGFLLGKWKKLKHNEWIFIKRKVKFWYNSFLTFKSHFLNCLHVATVLKPG